MKPTTKNQASMVARKKAAGLVLIRIWATEDDREALHALVKARAAVRDFDAGRQSFRMTK